MSDRRPHYRPVRRRAAAARITRLRPRVPRSRHRDKRPGRRHGPGPGADHARGQVSVPTRHHPRDDTKAVLRAGPDQHAHLRAPTRGFRRVPSTAQLPAQHRSRRPRPRVAARRVTAHPALPRVVVVVASAPR